MDDVAYDVISMYEHTPKTEIKKKVKEKYKLPCDGDIDGIFMEVEDLIKQGKLFSADVFDDIKSSAGRQMIKALCINISHECNMICDYCFAGRGRYGTGGLMSLETGKQAIDFLIKHSGGIKNLDVDFFGGEPLINWGAVKEIVGYARRVEREAGKNFRFTLTTNGLLIDDEVIAFTNEEISNVVLSLDGRPETNDAHRRIAGANVIKQNDALYDKSPFSKGEERLPAAKGSYNEVLPKIIKLVEDRGGKEYYIRGTFTRDNTDFHRDALHLADLGFAGVSLEPVVDAAGSEYELTIDDLSWINKQYELLADEMRIRKKEGGGFIFYHFILEPAGGPCIHKRITGCGVGTGYLAVSPQGDLYPCHQLIGEPGFVIGDVRRGIINKGLRNRFSDMHLLSRSECMECWAKYYCSGGCVANAYKSTGDLHGMYGLGCGMFKKRMECAIMLKVAEMEVNY